MRKFNIEIYKTKSCGLEVYLIKINGVTVASAMSERGAYNQFYRLQAKFKKLSA